MKNIYFSLLLVSTAMFAQLQSPAPYRLCDEQNDSVESFYLPSKDSEVLAINGLDPAQYEVSSYHLTPNEAITSVGALPENFINIGNPQFVYARVTEVSTGLFFNAAPVQLEVVPIPSGSVTGGGTFCQGDLAQVTFTGSGGVPPYTFTYTINNTPFQTVVSDGDSATIFVPATAPGLQSCTLLTVTSSEPLGCTGFSGESAILNVVAPPVAVDPPDMTDPSGIFDLNQQTEIITGGSVEYVVNYYLSLADAQNGSSAVLSPYQPTETPQLVYAAVTNVAGCFEIVDFLLLTDPIDYVYIPDPNFKQKLLSANAATNVAQIGTTNVVIDVNGDGEIQFSEAQAIETLNVSSTQIASLVGISAFTSLQELDFSGNSVSSVDVSALTLLTKLVCRDNELLALDVANLLNLQHLDVMNNQLTGLNLAGLSNLEYLNCSLNSMTALNLDGASNLIYMDCSGNSLGSLILSGHPALTEVNCSSNLLSSLSLNGLPSLKKLFCVGNTLSSLNVSSLSGLTHLSCGNNQLTSLSVGSLPDLQILELPFNFVAELDAANLSHLKIIDASSNEGIQLTLGTAPLESFSCNSCGLDALPVPPSNMLTFLSVGSNALTTLDLAGFPNLTEVICAFNDLETLDVSNLHNLSFLDCSNNLTLATLFIKNGTTEELGIQNNPGLTYVCADEEELQSLVDSLPSNVVVTTYCSIPPGGTYNTITGIVRFDAANNGCGTADPTPNLIKVSITDGTDTGYSFTEDGVFNFYVGTGTYAIAPMVDNSGFFNITPNAPMVSFDAINGDTQVVDFCLAPNGIHSDVEVIIAPLIPARPGFDAVYLISYRNKGNQVNSGQITFSYEEGVLDFISSAPAASAAADGMLIFSYNNLMPFETREIVVTLNVNAPTEIAPVNIGDVLDFAAEITIDGDDEILADNVFAQHQTVIGSYDPNEKKCIEGDVVSTVRIGDYLHYVINFENTGTDSAQNIVVRDVIDEAQFDVSSLQIIDSSHPVAARVSGNELEFFFKNIYLEIGGHGNILLKIKTLSTLSEGTTVSNRADIFFDYNYPVDTGFAHTLFQTLGVPGNAVAGIGIFPNPTDSSVRVSSPSAIREIMLYDIRGRLLQKTAVSAKSAEMDLSAREAGIYLMKIQTDSGSAIQKIIKY